MKASLFEIRFFATPAHFRKWLKLHHESIRELWVGFHKKASGRPKAWDFFQNQPASYRQTLIWWLVSAKKEETREQRLEKLIAQSEAGKRMM